MPRNTNAISPRHIERVMSQAAQIKDGLTNAAGALDVDVEEFLFILDQDTDLMSILDRFEYLISTKKDYAERAAAKAAQLKRQADAGRATVLAILQMLEVKKIERPTYTASIYKGRDTLEIEDPERVPFEYQMLIPDKAAITQALKAGEEVEGAHFNEGRPTLRIVRGKAQAEETSDAE